MSDLISREAVKELLNNNGLPYHINPVLWKELNELPPIQPKRGRWILDRSGAYCCSECMEPCASYVMMKPRDKFCKMCGAKMEVTT